MLPADASQGHQGLVGQQGVLLYCICILTVNNLAISSGSANQCLCRNLLLKPILEIRYCACTAQTAYQSGHGLPENMTTVTYLHLLTVTTEVTVNSSAVELSCVQCADPVLFWSGHLGGVVRHMHPVCQQHLPHQVSNASLFSACTASLFECCCHLPCMNTVCPLVQSATEQLTWLLVCRK